MMLHGGLGGDFFGATMMVAPGGLAHERIFGENVQVRSHYKGDARSKITSGHHPPISETFSMVNAVVFLIKFGAVYASESKWICLQALYGYLFAAISTRSICAVIDFCNDLIIAF
jgi:hypothetical protein